MRRKGMARSPCSGGLSVRTARTGWRGQAHASHGTRIGLHQGQQAPSSPGTLPLPPSPRVWGPPRVFPSAPSPPPEPQALAPRGRGGQCPPPPSPMALLPFILLRPPWPPSSLGWCQVSRQTTDAPLPCPLCPPCWTTVLPMAPAQLWGPTATRRALVLVPHPSPCAHWAPALTRQPRSSGLVPCSYGLTAQSKELVQPIVSDSSIARLLPGSRPGTQP